jgi:hypothetical protein
MGCSSLDRHSDGGKGAGALDALKRNINENVERYFREIAEIGKMFAGARWIGVVDGRPFQLYADPVVPSVHVDQHAGTFSRE